MVVERQQAPNAMHIDAIRFDAIRSRLLSQEWAADTVPELMQGLAKLYSLPETASQNEYCSLISGLLIHLDRFAAAAQAASTFNDVIAEERQQIASEIATLDQQVLQEEQEVQRLRAVLEREKNQVDRRAQYDALAKLILDCPPCDKSQKQLEEAHNEAQAVAKDIKELEDTKEAVRKELLLLAHCANGLEDTTQKLSALISEKKNQPDDSPEAMDTSL